MKTVSIKITEPVKILMVALARLLEVHSNYLSTSVRRNRSFIDIPLPGSKFYLYSLINQKIKFIEHLSGFLLQKINGALQIISGACLNPNCDASLRYEFLQFKYTQ